MSDFRLQDNVPNYYVDESRDFQLLCRVIDVILKGRMANAGYIPYQLDLDRCSESLLYAIAYMQGFTTKVYIPPNVLRNILKVFPYCIKHKGTEEAIRLAAQAVLSVDRLLYLIQIQTATNTGLAGTSYRIILTCNAQSAYIPYLREVMSFIVPAGWEIIYQPLNTIVRRATSKIDAKNAFARLSGITGRIGSDSPFRPAIDQGTSSTITLTDYSRIGLAKIIESKSKEKLLASEGYVSSGYTSQEGEGATNAFEKLIAADTGKTRFIGNHIIEEGQQ